MNKIFIVETGLSIKSQPVLNKNLKNLYSKLFYFKNQRPVSNLAFTLVELIVVITILAILGTIGFVSFEGYSSSARDSVRISDLTNIQKGLDLYQVKVGSYPAPDNPTTFSGGINTILNQGILGDSISRNINLNETVTDPLTKSNYIYSTISNGKYYQLYSELENTISYKNKLQIIPVSYADSNLKIPVIKGNYNLDPSLPSLLITDSTKSIATSSGIFDPNICFVLNNSTTNYLSSSSGTCTPKKNLNLKDFDNSLVGYWDMETICESGNCGSGNDGKLKDLSGNGNDGIFHEHLYQLQHDELFENDLILIEPDLFLIVEIVNH